MLWRLVFSGFFDYDMVFYRMSMDEVKEANAALDLHNEAVQEAHDKARQR